MEKGKLLIYTGNHKEGFLAAFGKAVSEAAAGKQVVIIRSLRGKNFWDSDFIKKMEPELKIFRFEKSEEDFENLSDEKKAEETENIRNGINYARKVLATGECNLLILDGIFELTGKKILTVEEVKNILKLQGDTDIIMIGKNPEAEICNLADCVLTVTVSSVMISAETT